MPWWGWAAIALVAFVLFVVFVVLPFILRMGRQRNIERMVVGAIKPTVYAEGLCTASVQEWDAGEVDMAMLEKRLASFPQWEQLVYDEARKLYFPDDMPELRPYIERIKQAERQMQAFIENVKRSQARTL